MGGNIKLEWSASIKSSKLKKLAWIYTPDHAGVKGNERAYELAGNAPITDNLHWCEAGRSDSYLSHLKTHSSPVG